MRLIPTIAALFVTLCWLACVVGMFATTGPWAFAWIAGAAVNGFLLCDLWAEAHQAWTGREDLGVE